MQRVEAIVEPELLVWARRKSGYEIEAAAKKAGVSPDKLAAWEQGSGRPSVKQLRRLAKAYRRRLAVFYLPEPPKDFPPIKDFRRIWKAAQKEPSPELLAEIEAAHERREVALDLLEAGAESLPAFGLRAGLDDDPNAVAARVRAALGIAVEEQVEWANARAGFNAWRFAIEMVGVLVYQMTTVDRDEARGFSIANRPLPAVVANNDDPYVARSFTVIHEFVHVALHESGLCDLSETARAERFCNHVAGAVLVPGRDLIDQWIVREHPLDDPEWSDDELRNLAQRYRVSREVVLRRLLILGRTNDRFYNAKRTELLDAQHRGVASDSQKSRWGPSPATIAVVRGGHYFSRLVLSSYSHGAITASDVATYLGVRMKHVPSIEKAVFRSRR